MERKLNARRKDNKIDHSIPPDALNSDILYCIKEYVRIVQHRQILRKHWFQGYSFEGLAEIYDLSTTAIKHVIYDIGDDILVRALELQEKRVAQEKGLNKL